MLTSSLHTPPYSPYIFSSSPRPGSHLRTPPLLLPSHPPPPSLTLILLLLLSHSCCPLILLLLFSHFCCPLILILLLLHSSCPLILLLLLSHSSPSSFFSFSHAPRPSGDSSSTGLLISPSCEFSSSPTTSIFWTRLALYDIFWAN